MIHEKRASLRRAAEALAEMSPVVGTSGNGCIDVTVCAEGEPSEVQMETVAEYIYACETVGEAIRDLENSLQREDSLRVAAYVLSTEMYRLRSRVMELEAK